MNAINAMCRYFTTIVIFVIALVVFGITQGALEIEADINGIQIAVVRG